ncbi:MAG: DUF1015 family protein [Lachnospiraceae bacterium]|jgi:uncharacterized protein (DUF1015 family)
MADIRPFRAYRPAPGLESTIAALPYDVFSRKEAKTYVDAHPGTFLAIDRPESQFPDSVDTYDDRVYRKAAQMLQERIRKGDFVQDPNSWYYLYSQTYEGRTQTGIVALASIDDYLHFVIRRNENTLEKKEKDRICHVDTCNAQTGPIFLAYRNDPVIDEITAEVLRQDPVCDFTSEGGVENRVFLINDRKKIDAIQKAFTGIDKIYIADGHHRAASAVKVGLSRREKNPGYTGEEEFNYFLSVLFPADELEIMAYNRIVKDLNGKTPEEILFEVGAKFEVESQRKHAVVPAKKGEIGMYLDGVWYRLNAKKDITSAEPVKGLDVSILQNEVLDPVFGIKNPKEDPRIEFAGGIRGTTFLKERADACHGAAFSMYPTNIHELFAVADARKLMPPKSTWFEPKLLSGLFIHELDGQK